jgi:plastocyanin
MCGIIHSALAQSATVTGMITVIRKNRASGDKPDHSNAVVWLKTLEPRGEVRIPAPRPQFEIRQQRKRFDPHVLPVPVGAIVSFPNLDPFFHNVFSMYDSKRFDLGLYEAGATHSVTFDRPGVCYIFCNIHPEMSAVVVVLDTPYYAISDRAGRFSIRDVPPARYFVSVWHERGKPESPKDFSREITISSENVALGTICLVDSGELIMPHKNKYGRDYESTTSPSVVYK